MKCQYCKNRCVKIGKQKDGTQKYRCKGCKKYQQEEYKYQAKVLMKRKLVAGMVVNNAGFSGTARTLNMSENTVKRTVMKESEKLKPPPVPANGIYEIDEMRVYHKKGVKDIWLIYALERNTGICTGIAVGKRDAPTIRKTVNSVLITTPKRIYTDGYVVYRSILPKHIHKVSKYMLSRVERMHLTLRNRIKMLNEGTLAFIRKPETLLALVKLLFWGELIKPQ